MFEQQSYEGDCSLIPFGSSPGHKLGACCACSKLAGELSQGITFPDYPFSDRYFANFFQPAHRKIKQKLAIQPDLAPYSRRSEQAGKTGCGLFGEGY